MNEYQKSVHAALERQKKEYANQTEAEFQKQIRAQMRAVKKAQMAQDEGSKNHRMKHSRQ